MSANDYEYKSLNISANILGLGYGATPSGLKAIKRMQELNNNKEVASNEMIPFLVLNTAGVTIIPTTVISFRALNNSTNQTEIVGACIIATVLSCALGLVMDRILYHVWRKKHD